jgi:hypothetical protein
MLKATAQSPRAWIWGLIASVAALVGLCTVGLLTQSFGFTFVVGAPFVAGFVIGRFVKVRLVVQVVYAVVVLASIVAAAYTVNLAGLVCGVVFGAIATFPLLAGVLVGAQLAGKLGATSSAACVVVMAVLIPLEPAALPAPQVETVRTERTFAMSAHEAFSRITFYEDTSRMPPKLLRIALPRPVRTVGEASKVGDRPRCIYDSGYIVKEITAVEPDRFYAFKVLEQKGVEEHAVTLLGGSFRLSKVDATHTDVELTTRYRPKLTARIAWRPFEQAVIRALHEHVLEEMMRP